MEKSITTVAPGAICLAAVSAPDVVINSFLSGLDNTNANTARSYRAALKAFFSYLLTHGIAAPTRADIIAYKRYLLEKDSALTVCLYLTAVRRFYAWAKAEGYVAENIAEGVKSPKHTTDHKKQHLEVDKIKALLSYYEADYAGDSSRDYAIVNLLLRTGLRTAELVGANIGDIQFRGNTRVLYIKGKGHTEKDDYVTLTEKAYAPIREYLKRRPLAQPGEALFTNNSRHLSKASGADSSRLTTRTIRNIVRGGLDAVGLDDKAFTAHSLRHTTAVAILSAGGVVDDVKTQLRHRSIATSMIYVESYNRDKQRERISEAIDNAF